MNGIATRSGLIPYYINKGVKYFGLIETYRDTIEFSKGHIDWTENELQCAIRECYEELKLIIDPNKYDIKFGCLKNKVQFYYVEVDKNIIQLQRAFNTFKSEIKNVLWLSEYETNEKIIPWQQKILVKILKKIV